MHLLSSLGCLFLFVLELTNAAAPRVIISTLLDDFGYASASFNQLGGWSALMIACEHGKFNIATLLCEQGASLNLQTVDGATALYLACWKNYLECVRLLCDRGAELNLQKEADGQPSR